MFDAKMCFCLIAALCSLFLKNAKAISNAFPQSKSKCSHF